MATITHFQGFASNDQVQWWGLGETVSFDTHAWVVSRAGGTVTFISNSGFTAPRFPSDVPVGVVDSLELRINGDLVATVTGLGSLQLSPATIGANPLKVLDGSDSFIGSSGPDTFTAGAGDDSLTGGAGSDSLVGGAGLDNLDGGAGADTLTDFEGAMISGGDGADVLTGFGGVVSGGAGDDVIESHNAETHGGDGNDTITFTATTNVILTGDGGDDRITFASSVPATVDGGTGDDTVIIGYTGGALTATRVGDVQLVGVEHVEILAGPTPVDVSGLGYGAIVRANPNLLGGALITGGAFSDTLSGGNGEDTIAGGAGDDVLDGGNTGWGNVVVGTGGIPSYHQEFVPPHFDLADYSRSARGVTVDLNLRTQDTGDGRDTLIGFEGVIGSAFDDILVGAPGDYNFNDMGDERRYAASRLYGGAGNDLLVGTNASTPGSLGNDTLVGGVGDDTLEGRSGDDLLDGGVGANRITGAAGADTFVIAADGQADRIDFSGADGDKLQLADASGAASSFTNALLIWDRRTGTLSIDADGDAGATSPQALATFSASETITASSLAAGFQPAAIRTIGADGVATTVQLDWGTRGTAGPDQLNGSAAADTLDGGAGDDWLYGKGGNDVLIGGAGADKFILSRDGSVDTLSDFNSAQGDHILLLDNDVTITNGSQGLLSVSASGVLSWDPDSDAGSAAPTVIGYLPAGTVLGRANLAAGFQPSGVRMVQASGDRQDVVFDWGSQSADFSRATYNAAGQLLKFDIYYDDGSRSEGSYDSANVTPEWSRLVAEYDKAGQLFAYSAVLDDGSKSLWLYDTTNSKPWQRVHEAYDAQGRLTEQAMLNDDGTGAERHIDAADTQPWAYYIDNYADGRLLNHTFYNANGTVFAG